VDYLKDEQYYIDLHDLFTVKECLQIIRQWQEMAVQHCNNEKIKDLPIEEKEKGFSQLLSSELFVVKAEKYKRKKETIEKWMADDRIKQNKLDTTPAPQNISCKSCGNPMKVIHKFLETYTDKPLRVLFFFTCPKCKKRRNIFENGEEDIPKIPLCPKCHKKAKVTYKETNKTLTTTTVCSYCHYKNGEVDDFEKHKRAREEQEKKHKKLLEKFRTEFCLSDEKGKEYIETIEAMSVANIVREEEKRKYSGPDYEETMQLKKIKIADLEKLLIETLNKSKFTKLLLGSPNFGQNVTVSFTFQDADPERPERISRQDAEKVINEALKNTNWRLVPNSTCYRLGYLEGQLKGYENEVDLLKLVSKKEVIKPVSKLDEDKRQKYAYHNLVQLARMMGKMDGIEDIRKRRLKREPEGFFLETSEGPYTCGLCGENHYGNEIWWTPDALYCADCWRNIKEGAVPPLKWDSDNKIWIKDWQIKSEFSIQSMTRKKLEREGILHGRQLKRQDGTVYFTVYLVSENKEFLQKYFRKPEMDIKLYWSDEHKSLMMNAKKIDYSKKPVLGKAEINKK